MKKILALAFCFVASTSSANADEQEATINKAAHVSGLVHCEREKRLKRYLWLKPGRIKFYHYEMVMPDGSTIVKVQDYKIAGVYDRRPFRESNPNLAIALPILNLGLQAGMNATNTLK